MDLGGAAGAPRGKKRQISSAEGAQKEKKHVLGAPEAVSLHGVPSIEIKLNISFFRPKGEFFLGGKFMFLLVKRRPKGGENFGRQILGGKSTKSTKRQIFGVEKKNYSFHVGEKLDFKKVTA